MNDEYDFSKAQRGKFFRKGASLVPPVRPERLAQLRAIPDSEIDTSDIPETGEAFVKSAKLKLPPSA